MLLCRVGWVGGRVGGEDTRGSGTSARPSKSVLAFAPVEHRMQTFNPSCWVLGARRKMCCCVSF